MRFYKLLHFLHANISIHVFWFFFSNKKVLGMKNYLVAAKKLSGGGRIFTYVQKWSSIFSLTAIEQRVYHDQFSTKSK